MKGKHKILVIIIIIVLFCAIIVVGLFNKFFKREDDAYPFDDAPNTAAITCVHVINKERPILHVTHDDDGYWQFLCGYSHSEDEARIISMAEAYELDKSVGKLSEMDYGHSADRKDKKSDWIIK